MSNINFQSTAKKHPVCSFLLELPSIDYEHNHLDTGNARLKSQ